jgi:aryl-alcohol dehydrogenase-like predicted oxidoreductase
MEGILMSMSSPWTSRRGSGRPLVTLGCMNFGKRTPEAEARRIVERALERGVRTFDTANVYNDGASERILGAALRGAAAGEVFVATKVGLDGMYEGKPEGLARGTVLAACDKSLARLGMDSVALYYLHKPDRDTPFVETLDALAELMRSGRIARFGVSNFASWKVLELLMACDARGLPRPAASQVIYNAAIRQIEMEHLELCAAYGLHVTVYNPLAGGMLAGTLAPGAAPAPGSRFDGNEMYQRRYLSNRMFAFAERFLQIAAREGRPSADVAHAWVAAQPGVDSILVGPGTLAHLDAALDALARPLSDEALAAITGLQRDFDGTDARYAR